MGVLDYGGVVRLCRFSMVFLGMGDWSEALVEMVGYPYLVDFAFDVLS